ncbi:MAG: hypothetical protein WC831_00555 [Parcubacteria group bacterium]|jgi:hypothetical protein
MEKQIKQIEKQIEELKSRNQRVESDKAWETSWFRTLSIMLITYAIAAAVFFLIGSQNFFRNALIPTVGYFLSAQSLPALKKWWIKKWYNK